MGKRNGMRPTAALLVCVASACAGLALALYPPDSDVVLVNKKSFKDVVVDGGAVSLVEFFAPWCGHCQQLAPKLEKVASNLQGIANVVAVDCDDAGAKELCSRHNVRGFPTLKIFVPSKNPYTGKFDAMPTDYNGPRTAKAIADAVLNTIPADGIAALSSAEDAKAFTSSQPGLAKVVLGTDKALSPLYKSLSMRFANRLAFAAVRESDKAAAADFGIAEFPKLLVLDADGAAHTYEGKLKAKEVTVFLAKYAGAAPVPLEDGPSSQSEDPGAEDGAGDKVVPQVLKDLNVSDVVERLAREEDAHLLAYFQEGAHSACGEQLAALNKAVAGLGPLVAAGRVNLSGAAQPAAAALGWDKVEPPPSVKGAAACKITIALAPFGEDKGEPGEWSRFAGEPSTRALQAFVLEGLPSFVTRLTAQTLQPFLQLNPRQPKVILFTERDATPGIFAALSVNLRRRGYGFADVHAREEHVLKQFGIKKVPAVVVAHLKKAEDLEAEAAGGPEAKLALQMYPGPLKYPYLHTFLVTFAGMLGAIPEDGAAQPKTSSSAEGGLELVNVPEAATTAQLEEYCLSKSGLCVLALLDRGATEHEAHLDVARGAAGHWQGQPLHFAWVDAARQPSFLAGFGLGIGDLPTAVAFSPKKRAGAQLLGTFSAAGMDRLLNGLFSGKVQAAPFQAVPALVEGGEAASGAEAEAVEEEFDLAEVLGEEGGLASKAARLQSVEAELAAQAEQRQREEEKAAAAAAAGKSTKKGKKRKVKRKNKSTQQKAEL